GAGQIKGKLLDALRVGPVFAHLLAGQSVVDPDAGRLVARGDEVAVGAPSGRVGRTRVPVQGSNGGARLCVDDANRTVFETGDELRTGGSGGEGDGARADGDTAGSNLDRDGRGDKKG